MVTRRPTALYAALVPNIGGAVPFGIADPGAGDLAGPELAGTVLLALAALALIFALTSGARGPLVVWAVRLGGVTWLTVAIVVALAPDLTILEHIGWALILAGAALANLFASDVLDMGDEPP